MSTRLRFAGLLRALLACSTLACFWCALMCSASTFGIEPVVSFANRAHLSLKCALFFGLRSYRSTESCGVSRIQIHAFESLECCIKEFL